MHILTAFVLLSPFIIIFALATYLEFMRWWRYGPAQNRRASFPINELAPSYASLRISKAVGGKSRENGPRRAPDHDLRRNPTR